jgi:hypothetical protein
LSVIDSGRPEIFAEVRKRGYDKELLKSFGIHFSATRKEIFEYSPESRKSGRENDSFFGRTILQGLGYSRRI